MVPNDVDIMTIDNVLRYQSYECLVPKNIITYDGITTYLKMSGPKVSWNYASKNVRSLRII